MNPGTVPLVSNRVTIDGPPIPQIPITNNCTISVIQAYQRAARPATLTIRDTATGGLQNRGPDGPGQERSGAALDRLNTTRQKDAVHDGIRGSILAFVLATSSRKPG